MVSAPLITLIALFSTGLDLKTHGQELIYKGDLAQVDRRTGSTPVKQFEIYCMVTAEQNKPTIAFLVDEVGGGGWPWPERFGQLGISPEVAPFGGSRMRLLHTFNDTQYPVALPVPLFPAPEKLSEGSMWSQNKLRYEVTGSKTVQKQPCWQVEVRNEFTQLATMSISQETHLLVRSEQTVFMGRGDRFKLKMELQSRKETPVSQLNKSRMVSASLLNLQQELKRDPNLTGAGLTQEQLKVAAALLPKLEQQGTETPWQNLVVTIRNNLRRETSRMSDEESLAKKYVGKKVADLKLIGLDGKPVDPKEYQGKITLLHFWYYRGDPLKEPYGQVGYLDFLYNRCQKLKFNVQIYGVAIDPRLADPALRGKSVRSIQELKSFFNLSYPVTTDAHGLLEKFGDPREISSPLPLWVLIDPEGVIRHYSIGNYEIQPNRGLKQLEAEVVKLVKEQRAGK